MQDVMSHVETLEKLGLTSLQAKLYLTVATLHKASVGEIAATADTARPDVYRILPVLEKQGLLKKIITTPMMYEATPLKEGCALLLQRKKEEYIEAKEKSQSLIEEFNKQTIKVTGGTENFSVISSKELLVERFAAADAATKTRLDIISDWVTLSFLLFSLESFKKLGERGVRIRIITEKLAATDKKIDNPFCEIRYLDGPVPIRAAIYDGKVANMRVRTQQDREMTPALWSDNPDFVQMMVVYYENIWEKAQKSP